jgi:hypothetical protein
VATPERQRTYLQDLAELREEDSLVAEAIQVEPYEAGNLIAEPDVLDAML